jgi:hypothetical protein
VQPGMTVRAIEYEIVPASQAASLGLTPAALKEQLGSVTRVGVLRCVNSRGEKLTAMGDAKQLEALLDSGEAGRPTGMGLSKQAFPVVLQGWLQAS